MENEDNIVWLFEVICGGDSEGEKKNEEKHLV